MGMANFDKVNWQKWTGRSLIAITGTLILLYLFLSPINGPLYDLLMFPIVDPRTPDRTKEFNQLAKMHVTRKDVTFRSANGRKLKGWFFELPGTKRVFLFSHGKGENIFAKLNSAKLLLQCGGSVFMYDYQGYGLSEGKTSITNACNDAVAAYDYLVSKEHRTSKDIIAFGESFGSGVSSQLLLKRPLAGVIFQSGFSSLLRAGRDRLVWLNAYPDWAFPEYLKLDNAAVFRKPHPPLLIVHGKSDRTVSYANAEDLYRSAVEPKMLLPVADGPHCCFGKGDEFLLCVRSFLNTYKI
jgi:alpha-beta hydrolase superfamily lysophospholipase